MRENGQCRSPAELLFSFLQTSMCSVVCSLPLAVGFAPPCFGRRSASAARKPSSGEKIARSSRGGCDGGAGGGFNTPGGSADASGHSGGTSASQFAHSSSGDAEAMQQQLLQLRLSISAHRERMEQCAAQQQYAAAAEERDAVQRLELQARQLQLEAAAAAESAAGVAHRIGTIIYHRRFGYRGVIFGFDPRCQAPDEWCAAMQVDRLERGRQQPFYHVLVDTRDRPGEQTTYVAQENIVPAPPREVRHPLVPRFFTGLSEEEGAYLPGPLLREAYPHLF